MKTRTVVSEDAFRRIVAAIDEIARDDSMRRTKIQIEALSGLSHPTVARAFAQDKREPTQFAINERFVALRTSRGLSPAEIAERDLQSQLNESKERVNQLEAERAQHLQVIYALYLASRSVGRAGPGTPIKRRRNSR